MEQDQTKEELRKRIEALESENKRLRENKEQSGSSRRRVLAGVAGVAAAGVGVAAFSGSASAEPSGTYPVETDDSFLKTRVDRVRFISRSTKPATPSTGRVVMYVDEGDLP